MFETAERLQPPLQESFDKDYRLKADTETWLAETLNGSMRTTFEYRYDIEKNDLISEDGGGMGEVFENAIVAAKQIAINNPSLMFEYRRRVIEYGEYQDMLSMAQGDAPNTIVTLSDFPPELMEEGRDVGGYNSSRKQTMMRVITKQEDGSIRMTTQSLDGSNRQALESVCQSLGFVPEEGELLGQRIHIDLSEADQHHLPSVLTKYYDQSLSSQYGGSWHGGIKQTSGRKMIDTYSFVRDQTDIIDWFLKHKLEDSVAGEKYRLNLAATIKKRYEDNISGVQTTNMPGVSVVYESQTRLMHEINQATNQAIQNGEVFSGCGMTVGGESSTGDQIRTSGFGNKIDEDCEFVSKKCPMCGAKNVKTVVTAKSISGSCGCSKSK